MENLERGTIARIEWTRGSGLTTIHFFDHEPVHAEAGPFFRALAQEFESAIGQGIEFETEEVAGVPMMMTNFRPAFGPGEGCEDCPCYERGYAKSVDDMENLDERLRDAARDAREGY